ncbi:hypothetical protein OUZ56_012902 [Daphnia magna]|uniref:Uncharacterized protein n=1 Tax=Daphnia magna TaxID=35525 RepID=A0ABQ9Z552_9CRUS|nr:hypothetical protein OUZ56_012902 [Daphnia magna]
MTGGKRHKTAYGSQEPSRIPAVAVLPSLSAVSPVAEPARNQRRPKQTRDPVITAKSKTPAAASSVEPDKAQQTLVIVLARHGEKQFQGPLAIAR